MDERWNRVAEIYHQALARDQDARAAYLFEACPEDESLRLEVEKLLDYDARAQAFLERPLISDLASDLANTIPAAPERIGPYQVESRLGVGGMGEVYLATDSLLGRPVALKLMRPDRAAHLDARSRFLQEARSAAALNHPNIATVFDAGEVDGRLYLVMEYVGGQSLASLLRAGPLPESDVIEYGIQIASALDHAHSRGILHRDIKPENVIVESGGAAKLVDFGIAKIMPADSERATQITTPGLFVGTVKYAPPELLSGRPANRQSDIYSFGVTLFEMACGQTPFDALSLMGAVGAILHGERAKVREGNPSISEGLAEVIERSMSRDPEERFPTVAGMGLALSAVRDSGGASTAVARPEPSRVPALALLEFTNLSRDASMDWLGVGIAETLEGELRRVSGLRVINRARTQQMIRGLHLNAEDPAHLITLGHRVDARWIGTGSFQRAGNRIRVMCSILHVPAGEVVPAGKVDGAWDDLFDVQDRVVAALREALQLENSPTGEPRPQMAAAPSLDAYEHYAVGRRLLNQMGRNSLLQAKEHFEKAIALDPKYALAYSGLGTAHALTFIQTSNPDDLQHARQFLERALELDSELGEPYPWLCNIYCRMGDAGKSLAAGEKGVRLQPDLAMANYFHAACLVAAVEAGLGSYQKGLNGLTQALILEPRMGANWMVAGFGALLTGQYTASQWLFEGASQIETTPNPRYRFVGASTMLGFVHARQLAWDAARRCHRESIEMLRASGARVSRCLHRLECLRIGRNRTAQRTAGTGVDPLPSRLADRQRAAADGGQRPAQDSLPGGDGRRLRRPRRNR